MPIKTETRPSLDHLVHLPAFAGYILSHRLDDYVQLVFKATTEVDIPLMRFINALSKEQRYEIVLEGTKEFLEYLAENKARAFIDLSVKRWLNNQLPVISMNDITAEDITYATYVRKKTLTDMLADYSKNTEQLVNTIREIDFFLAESETASSHTLISILKNQIDEHAHFIEKITNTSPGIIYVYDVINNREVYTNRATTEYLGYTNEEIINMGSDFVSKLMHPDDLKQLRHYEKEFASTRDGEIRTFRYRFLDKNGNYRWLRTFETVFKRDRQNRIVEKIGIAIDVNQQMLVSEQLMKREAELLEAQEIAQLGSFNWNLENNTGSVTPETYKILGAGAKDYEQFIQLVHPDDREAVQSQVENSLETCQLSCEFRYRDEGNNKTIWLRGKVNYKNKKPVSITGTVMDVTEHHQLIEKLRRNDEAFKRAESITHIGNYTWNTKTNKIEWSDEIYRIYGMEPQSIAMDFELAEKFIHPEDVENVKREMAKAFKTKEDFDFSYRIISYNGAEKFLQAKGKHIYTDGGNTHLIIGSLQDITEKQTLIRKLQRSQDIYRQAEELANMGNWSWDIKNNSIEWTDQLYRIYGLQPGSIEITLERYLSFIHPDDKEHLKNRIEELRTKNFLDQTFRIIAADGKEKIIRSVTHVEKNDNGEPVLAIGSERDVTEKQMMIQQLQQSESLYKQAQALSLVGNWTIDLKTRQFTWSDEMYKIHELEIGSEITWEKWITFVHPDEREYVTALIQDSIRNQVQYDHIHSILLPNGKIKILHRKADFILDEKGRPVKMIGTTQDITRQYRTEQELRENQMFVKKITDATPSIIASYNVNTGKYVFISEGLEKLLGYDVNEVMEKGTAFFAGIIHPEDLPGVVEKNLQALEEANTDPSKSEMVVEFTYRMLHHNGYYRWFHTYGTIFDWNNENKAEHVLNISLDITEQKAASAKLEEQEYFIQQIADASPTILYLFDVEKQSLIYLNREIFFVLGYLPDEIIELGSEVSDLYHPDDYHLLPERNNSGKVFQQVDSMIQYECRIKHKDGDWRWLLCREIVFKVDQDGKVNLILGAALDINRRKEMEKTILQNTMLLEQSNASLEEFAYVASHDLKEPLRKISTFGDRLVASQMENLNVEGKIYLNKIIDASQRMQTMISDLLSISMITGNKAFEEYSLRQILDETLQTLEYKIEQQNAVIRYDILPEAKIIPSQFRQLFQNLLSNSLKFSREGVQPLITIKHSYIDHVEWGQHQVAPASQYHKIDLTDNGIGFENEFAGKIFAIFQRLHGRSEYEGSGIGLAICKKIVEHHGGIIYAQGEPGVGATFTIILPS